MGFAASTGFGLAASGGIIAKTVAGPTQRNLASRVLSGHGVVGFIDIGIGTRRSYIQNC